MSSYSLVVYLKNGCLSKVSNFKLGFFFHALAGNGQICDAAHWPFWACQQRYSIFYVCASNGKYSSLKRTPESENLLCADSYPEALASRKVVWSNPSIEVSGTANVWTDEQKLDKRHSRADKIAHHIKVRRIQKLCYVDSAGLNRRVFVLPGESFLVTG